MKKLVSLLLLNFICFLCVPAYAASNIPDFCMPIMEAWGATNEKELQQAILKYWEENQPRDWKGMHKGAKTPVSFQFGGTTEELIANHKKWDVAIVSSKEVDLDMLADAGVIVCDRGWPTPVAFLALDQWAYPQAVQQMLPEDPLYYYYVYCYSYDTKTDEAIFVICNEKDRPRRWYNHSARQIIENRSVNQTRALEGLCRKIDWDNFGMPELSDTEDDLVANPMDWDWAFLRINKEDRLEKLDQAGLLYDFSQDEYWVSRNPAWEEPSGVWSTDGRMIAVPYNQWNYNAENEISVFVVNAKSPVLARALTYAKHYIKCYEWDAFGKDSYYSNPAEMQKYIKHFEPGSSVILKKDVNW